MGGIIATLKLSSRPGADLGTLEQAHEVVKQELWGFLDYYGQAPDVWDRYLNELPYQTDQFRFIDDNQLGFGFPDCAGCCGRSQQLAYRWVRLALSAAHDSIEAGLSELGYHPIEVPRLRVVLEEERPAFLKTRGKLWFIRTSGDSLEICGDNEVLEPTDEELARARELTATGQTHDPVESMLRPDSETDAAFAKHLRRSGDHMPSVLWYVGNCAMPSEDLVAALCTAAQRTEVIAVLHAAERLGARAALGDRIHKHLEHEDGRVRAAALATVSGQVDQELLSREAAAELLFAALERTGHEQAVATEHLGRVRTPALESRITAAMCKLLSSDSLDDEVAHGAVLTLANQYMMTQAPADVYATLSRAAKHSTPWGGLANWFLEHHTSRGWY